MSTLFAGNGVRNSQEKQAKHYLMQHYSLNNSNLFIASGSERKLVDYLWRGSVTNKTRSDGGKTEKQKLEYEIRGTSQWILNSYDLGTWLAILYLHRIRELEFKGDKPGLEMQGVALDKPMVRIKTTRYHLLGLLGRSRDKRSYDALIKSMERLSSVHLIFTITNEQNKRQIWSSRLFDFHLDENNKGTSVVFAINPVFAETAMKQFNDKPTSLHCLEDYRKLGSKQALLQYSWCSRMHPGTKATYKLKSVIRYIHGTEEVDRRLKSAAKKAAMAMDGQAGWSVKYDEAEELFTVTRPQETWK